MGVKDTGIDDLDIEILSALYYLGSATATDLEKILGDRITRAGISKRLKKLVEKGYLKKPEIDISENKLKKIYHAPDRETLGRAMFEWYKSEIYDWITERVGDSYEYTPEDAFKDDRITTLGLKSAENLRKLKDGVDLKEAVELLDGYAELFSYEIAGLITVDNGIVKLTDDGLRAILNEWIKEIEEKLNALKELDPKAYEKLLSEFC